MARLRARRRPWERFAHWAPGAAVLAAALCLALLVLAALTVRTDLLPGGSAPASETVISGPATGPAATNLAEDTPRDTDLRLYDRIAERVGAGENYYRVAVEEQRARDFPVRPGLAVRLPTLAHVSGALGEWGMITLAALLGLATLAAWYWRLEHEPGGSDHRVYVLLLLVIGAASGFKPQYLALHEVWAGMLLALALALHRRGRWMGAWVAAALALCLRELALPFVLLLGALALIRGDRREAAAWGVLVVVFGIGLAWHLAQVAQVTGPADPLSPSWFALRGLGGWTANVILSSPLYLLPGWLAAPLVLLPLIGWAGWKCDLGLAGFLLCAGYGVAFMIAGRDANFYWALVVMPVWFIGLAFVPRTLAGLWNSAHGH